MPRFEQMRDRLPTLYRPDDGDTTLLTRYLSAVADVLEEINAEASEVLQAHWYGYADRAAYHPFLVRGRVLEGLAPLIPGDLVELADPAGVIARLRAASGPLSQYLRERFSPETRLLLDQHAPSSSTIALQRALVEELNRIVRGPSIFDEDRFAGIQLSEETRDLLDSEPRGNDLIFLNRRLLEEAYPGEIVGSRLDHPYVHDLARLGSLLPLSPWQEPPALRESVEAYRLRISRFVTLYRNGLGTPGALRRIIEAQLPVDLEGPPEERDRPFLLEEFAPLVRRSQAITAPGEPLDMVGPLMRWTLENDGLTAAAPTLYIQGVQPVAEEVGATENPLIELYYGGDGPPPLGIAYQDTVAPGETLRLRPAYASWTGLDNGLRRARSRPTETTPADPTAPGPWQRVEGAPETMVVALHQSHDRSLWVATDDDGEGELWRFDGQEWVSALSDLAAPRCLAEDGRDLLIGTTAGLLRMSLYPEGGFSTSNVPGLEEKVVNTLLYAESRWWIGAPEGIFLLEDDGEVQPFGLREDQGTAVEVCAIHQDASGTLYFGTELGLFQHQPGTGHWYYYVGGTSTEQEPDWKEFVPGAGGEEGKLPSEDEVFLPLVHAVYRGPDASLWLGTERGIARYVARPVQGLTYETVLEAFPDLTGGRVFAIEEDARGLVWFCTDRGLLRYDGRDWWQPRTDGWKQLGAAVNLFNGQPEPRGSWCFVRSSSTWKRKGSEEGGFEPFPVALRTTNPAAVRALLWTDQVEAD